MSGIRITEEEYAAIIARQKARNNRPSDPSPDLEPDSDNGSSAKNVGEAVHSRFHIRVHSKRRRLTDPDGLSAKFAIDGLVKGGLLEDDSPTYVESVTFSQELSQLEETIIELWETGDVK